MEEKRTEVLVVGGGPAGYTAALYCARAGLSVRVLEGTAPGGQMAQTEAVDNYAGFDETVTGWQLAQQMRRGAERFGAETVFAQVTALNLTEAVKTAETPQGTFESRAVIYAAGAGPRTLDVPGEEALRGRGVSFCATCDGAFFRDRTVAVVGGGNSAAAEALSLAGLCRRVVLVHRRQALRAERSAVEALERAENVAFLWNAQVEAVLGETAVTGLQYTDLATGLRRELACDGVFVAVGRRPETKLLAGQVELDGQGYVQADETTRTSLPGVFAAGDVRAKPVRQIVTAAADGAVAAHFAEEYLRN